MKKTGSFSKRSQILSDFESQPCLSVLKFGMTTGLKVSVNGTMADLKVSDNGTMANLKVSDNGTMANLKVLNNGTMADLKVSVNGTMADLKMSDNQGHCKQCTEQCTQADRKVTIINSQKG